MMMIDSSHYSSSSHSPLDSKPSTTSIWFKNNESMCGLSC